MDNNNLIIKSLIKIHLIFSGLSFLTFSILLLLSAKEIGIHYFQPKILAITHIATLCWLTTFLFALLYNHVPVIFSRKLYSTILAKIGFWIFLIGTVMLVVAFWRNNYGGMLIGSAHLLSIPFVLLLINIIITAIKAPKRDIEQWFFITSVVWLMLTVAVGILLAMNFKSQIFSGSHLEWLKLHANIGFTGWFLQFIIGMAAKSLNTENQKKQALKIAYYLINIGLLLYFFYQGHNQANLFEYPLVLIVAGIISALVYISKLLLKINQVSIIKVFGALFALSLPVALAFFQVYSSTNDTTIITRAGIIYGVSVLLGVVGLWTFSQLNTLSSYIKPTFSIEKETKEGLFLRKKTDALSLIHLASYLMAVVTLIIGIILNKELINVAASATLILSAVLFNILLFRSIFQKIKD